MYDLEAELAKLNKWQYLNLATFACVVAILLLQLF